MRRLILVVLIIGPLMAGAQSANTFRDMRVQPNALIGCPVGDFNHNTSNKFIAGQAKIGLGAGATICKSLDSKWTVGMVIQVLDYWLDKEKLKKQLAQHYSSPDFYVTNDYVFNHVEVVYTGLTVLYKLNTHRVEIEPGVRLGVGFGDIKDKWGAHQVYRKKKNDNYHETVTMFSEGSNAFLYYSFGITASKPLYKWLYLCGGVYYTGGTYVQRFSEHAYDYLNESHSPTYFTIRQPITAVQTELGVQFRFRFPPRHKKLGVGDTTKH